METDGLKRGLYRVFWKTGGSSLAAVGSTFEGKRWIAPCNWASAATSDRDIWDLVERVELIEAIDG